MEGFLDSINKKRKEEGKPEISDIDEMSPSERREAQVFSQKRKSNRDLKREHKEEELLEALGGGLTDSAPFEEETTQKLNLVELQRDTIIDNKNTVPEKEKLDLDEVIGSGPEVDTESGELKVVLKQKTEVGNDITFLCQFEDFYEDELVVLAPKNSLAAKTEVKAKVTLTYKGQKVIVVLGGEIEEVEEFDLVQDTVIVQVKNLNKEDYEKFISLYQERQGSINEFLELARGY